MRKQWLLGILSVTLLALLVVFGQRAFAQNPTPTPAPGMTSPLEVLGDARRMLNTAAPDAITSLPMSNPYCSQPDPAVNQCFVNVRYFQANDNGTGNVLAYVNMSIDGKLRYRSNAFFENFVTYSFDMIPGGIKVACGLPNEGGFGALYGKGYTIDVKAYDITNNWVLDDQLAVKCPAFNP
jgi:hypothetical protein